jgi:hypothetical protein
MLNIGLSVKSIFSSSQRKPKEAHNHRFSYN